MFQTNLRETDAALDVEAVLDVIGRHGADTWLVNAGGILSFYPTELPFQTRNPHLAERPGGDLLGDAVRGAHARGVRVMARMDFSKVAPRIAAEHPEWCFVSPTGQPQEYNDLVSVCPSGEYYQDRTFKILDEVMDRYPIDGFFFNWFGFNEVDYASTYHGVCHCMACHSAFAAFGHGTALPLGPGDASYPLWREFSAETVELLTARIRAHIASRHPDAGLILGEASDIVFHEANNAVGRELWPHATAESVSASASFRPDVPVLVNAVTFVDMPYRMAGEEPHHFAAYLTQTLARGGNPSTYIMGVPGEIPYPALDVAGRLTRFHAEHAGVYANLWPAAAVGLVRLPRVGIEHGLASRSREEFRGWYTALQERHVPFDVLALEHVEEIDGAGELDRYTLLVLPDVGPIPPSLARILDAFVERGGRLVSTGSSAIADGAIQLASMPATRERAVQRDAERLKGTYVAASPVLERGSGTYPSPVLPVIGAFHYLDWDDDADRHLTLLARAPYGPPEKAHGQRPVNHPGYGIGHHGGGTTALVPWTPGRTYHQLGLSAVRDVLVDLVLEILDGADPVRVQAPEQVEVTVHRSGDDLVVHLLNHSGARRRSFGPPLPVRGVTVGVSADGGLPTARALVADVLCEVTDGGDGSAVVHVPQVDLFEVLVLHPMTIEEH